MHETPVASVGVGLDGPFIFETAGHGEITARSVFTPARVRHRIVTDGWIMLLSAEPGGYRGDRARRQHAQVCRPLRF